MFLSPSSTNHVKLCFDSRFPSYTGQVLEQIPARSAFGAERANKLFLAAFGGAVLDNGISPTMLFAINKVREGLASRFPWPDRFVPDE